MGLTRRRDRLLLANPYTRVSAPCCVYCQQPAATGADHVPPVTATSKPRPDWPGLFLYPACTDCNISLRTFAATCLVARAACIHDRALRNPRRTPHGLRAPKRAALTLWAKAADARSPYCRCARCYAGPAMPTEGRV